MMVLVGRNEAHSKRLGEANALLKTRTSSDQNWSSDDLFCDYDIIKM